MKKAQQPAGDLSVYRDRGYEHTGVMNLNDVHAEICDGTTHLPDPIIGDGVEVLFKNQRAKIIELINRSSTVVGCVAWLTDLAVLAALQNKRVCIVIQKEDFLRPDSDFSDDYYVKLRSAYERLSGIHRWSLNTPFSISSDSEPEPAILCAGLANPQRKAAHPRMHNKFLLFRFSDVPATQEDYEQDEATVDKLGTFDAVFTGSYNITHNATNSLENSIIITQQPIVDGYYKTFEHIFGISEPLDWNSEWVNPRYRVGT